MASPISRFLIQDVPSRDWEAPSIKPADNRLCIDASSTAHSRFDAIGPIMAYPTNLAVHFVRRSRLSRAVGDSPLMTSSRRDFSSARLARFTASSGAIITKRYSRSTKCESVRTKQIQVQIETYLQGPFPRTWLSGLPRSEMPISTWAGNGFPEWANAERASYVSRRNRRRVALLMADINASSPSGCSSSFCCQNASGRKSSIKSQNSATQSVLRSASHTSIFR